MSGTKFGDHQDKYLFRQETGYNKPGYRTRKLPERINTMHQLLSAHFLIMPVIVDNAVKIELYQPVVSGITE